MRSILIFLIFTVQLTAQENIFSKGIITEPISVSDTLDETYSLYFPTTFSGNEELPVVFLFDGQGRGRSAGRIFQKAAEEQGYILASSNSILPSKSLEENLKTAVRLIQEVSQKIPLNFRSITVAGFAEGAQVASAIPLIYKDIQGVIYIGDHYFNFDMLRDHKPFVAIGMVGNRQANMADMETTAYNLRSMSFAGDLYRFEGGKEWPNPQLVYSAVGYMTLQAMKAKERPKDISLITKLYQEDLNWANQLISNGNYFIARDFLDGMMEKYRGLMETREIKEKLDHLEKSENYKDQAEEFAEVYEKEERLWNDFLFYFNDDISSANFPNIGWWNYQKMQLQELTKSDNKLEAAMGYRLLEMLEKLSLIKIEAVEVEKRPLEEKLMAYMLATVFDQTNFDAYKKVISLSTLDGDFATALFYLEEMLKNGYKDLESLYEIEGTLGLKITKEYNWLIKKYLGKSKYFENTTTP